MAGDGVLNQQRRGRQRLGTRRFSTASKSEAATTTPKTHKNMPVKSKSHFSRGLSSHGSASTTHRGKEKSSARMRETGLERRSIQNCMTLARGRREIKARDVSFLA